MDVWMSNLPTALTTVPLHHLAIPGSHDSGAFHMSMDLSPSAPSALDYVSWIPGVSLLTGTIMIAMSTCQSHTIGEQLDLGIRYLDFRVSWWKNDFYFVHSVYGTKVSIALNEMKTFLDDNPKEVVILHIQQFHQIGSSQHGKLIALLKSTFGHKLTPAIGLDKLTLKHMWDNKHQVILIYQNSAASDEKNFWSSSVIESPWPNSASANTVISKLNSYMDDAKDVKNKFFVCQGVVTPDTDSIIRHLVMDSSLRSLTSGFNYAFMEWLADSASKWTNQPNIVLHDFVEMDDYVKNVLALNKYRTTKDSPCGLN